MRFSLRWLLGIFLLAGPLCYAFHLHCRGSPVSGVVTLDGKPLDDVHVLFERNDGDVESMGLTDKNGRYRLNGRDHKLSTPIGKYRVIIIANDFEPGATLISPGDPMKPYEGRVPLKYLDGTIELHWTVRLGGTDSANFKLDSRRRPAVRLASKR